MLVGWFCVCAIIWAVGFLPREYGKYSLFYAVKYAEGLLALYLALQVKLSPQRKVILHGLFIAGGVFVALYCIPEYFGWLGAKIITVSGDRTIEIATNMLTGPLSPSYFHLAQYSSFAFAFALTYSLLIDRPLVQLLCLAGALFISWPLYFSGSRMGIGLALISLFLLFAMVPAIRKRAMIVALSLLLGLTLAGGNLSQRFWETGRTFERLRNLEERDGSDSLSQRLLLPLHWEFTNYRWKGASVPFIGAGFYVAPIYNSGSPRYRVGYGVHSMYLFPVEQGGIVAGVLFLLFVGTTIRQSFRMKNSQFGIDQVFIFGFLVYFLSTLLVGIGGHNFWVGFGSGNFNTCLLLMLLIAITPTAKPSTPSAHIVQGTDMA